MLIAILSDVHANLPALEAVLKACRERAVDVYACLGDIVGYGPSPGPCLELVRDVCEVVVRGNHDVAVGYGQDIDLLPEDGRKAAALHRSLLSQEALTYLAELPLHAEREGCTFVHASPERPAAWLRIESPFQARQQFSHFDTDYCFIGHTHIPGILADRFGLFTVKPGHRYLINVGSVGQPRDGDPRAAFGLFDTDTGSYELVRVAYDVESTVSAIRKAGLPDRLARRLRNGR